MVEQPKKNNHGLIFLKTEIDPFSSDVMKIVSGTTIAQIITILSAPVITRIYGPELFGIFALFISVVNILNVVSCLRYENAIMLPKSDEDAVNIVGLCLIIVSLITAILLIVCLFLNNQITDIFHIQTISSYLWLMPLFIFINGLFLILNYWNTRTKRFSRLSVAKIVGAIFTNGIQLGLGIVGFISGIGLIIGTFIGQILSTVVLVAKIWKDDRAMFKNRISHRGMIQSFKRYSNFPRYDLWSAFLNTLSAQLPIIMLAIFFSTQIVGYYSIAFMVLIFPTTFIGGAIAQVFFQRASEAHNIDKTQLLNLVETTLMKLIAIAILPFIIILFFGQDLFSVVFGISWNTAGYYSQILAIWIFLAFIASPISTLFAVLEKLEFSLKINVITFISRFVAIYIGGLYGNPVISIALYSFVGIFSVGGSLIWLLHQAEITGIMVVNRVGKYIYEAFFIVFVMLIAKYFLNFSSLLVFIAACAGMGIYYLINLKNLDFIQSYNQ